MSRTVVISTVPTAVFLRPVIPLFRAAALADALAGSLLFFGLAGITQQPVHHWHLSYSNRCANSLIVYFQ
jgi:hypothetical protein